MVDEKTNDEFAGYSIDPATWEDPKQSFPGEILESEFRWANDKYRAATEFRPELTEPLLQWNLVVKRLDAIGESATDGSQSDVIYFGGVDMKRWNDLAGKLVPISSRYPKEWEIVGAHKKLFGVLNDPKSLVGKKAMFDFFATKTYGTVVAKRVLLPASALAPDYEFTGEKAVFIRRDRNEDTAEAAESPNGTTDLMSRADAMELLPSLLVGQKAGDVAGLIAVIPQKARLPEILNEVATGQLVALLAESGAITLDAEGMIS